MMNDLSFERELGADLSCDEKVFRSSLQGRIKVDQGSGTSMEHLQKSSGRKA